MVLALCTGAMGQVYDKNGVRLDAALSLLEMYDSNVMLQSEGQLANKGSAVSVVNPTIGLTLDKPLGLSGKLKFDYGLFAQVYHSRPDETHADQMFGLKFTGGQDQWTYEAGQSLLLVDGDSNSFVSYGPDGATALGDPEVRNRRDELLTRGSYKLQYGTDTWLVRGVSTNYYVNWGMRQKAIAGYSNYTPRGDVNAGFDLGAKVYDGIFAIAGYRAGYQEQGMVIGSSLYASNNYHRVLFGAEGKVGKVLKFNFLVGPDFRNYCEGADPHNDDVKIYLEGVATWKVTKADELIWTMKQWTLPAATGKTTFDDSFYDLAWKHAWGSGFSSTLAMKVLGGEWNPPVHRDDWVYAPRVVGEYELNKNLSFEAGCQLELGRSADRNLDGRDYDRFLGWVGAKWKF